MSVERTQPYTKRVVGSIKLYSKTVIGCSKKGRKPSHGLVLGYRRHSRCDYYRNSPTSDLVKLKLISFPLNSTRRNVGAGAGAEWWREGLM